MPTQPSTSIPKIGSDAAPLVPEPPLTFVRAVVTVPDTDMGRQPASALERVSCTLKRVWRGYQEQRQQYRLRMGLLSLTERELKNIGITSADIGYITAHRDIDRLRDGTMYPWMR